jgi:putative ABC transport system permease protein
LTIFAIALGVAVVIAIRLAGDAAAGSFRSSMETLAGRATLEIVATGGVDERVLGDLVTLPQPLEFFSRIESHCTIASTGITVPLIGLDLIAQDERPAETAQDDDGWKALRDARSIWVSTAFGWRKGDRVRLVTGDQTEEFQVQGVLDGQDQFIVMDIGAAQQAFNRPGRVDRLRFTSDGADSSAWRAALRGLLPDVEIRPFGTGTAQNRQMLEAFRWNLRVLSYIALVVVRSSSLAISVSVVRRRAEIGVLKLEPPAGRCVLCFSPSPPCLGSLGPELVWFLAPCWPVSPCSYSPQRSRLSLSAAHPVRWGSTARRPPRLFWWGLGHHWWPHLLRHGKHPG